MKLELKNFAKIKDASINIDGITVIAGNNNTGKSTIGKALYCMYNSLCDIAGQIEDHRKRSLHSVCDRPLRNILLHRSNSKSTSLIGRQASNVQLSRRICSDLINVLLSDEHTSFSKKVFRECIESSCGEYGVSLEDDILQGYVEETYDSVVKIRDMESRKIALQVIEEFFNEVFENQIQNLKFYGRASINLCIKGRKTEVVFENNECIDWRPGVEIIHRAFLLDDPFVLDELRDNLYSSTRLTNPVRLSLLERIVSDAKKEDLVIDSVLAREKLKEINKLLSDITAGDISTSVGSGSWALQSKYFNDPVMFRNLSAGLKSFVLLRILLEKGILADRDVLVLDEPEIHLHPEWQIRYAEIIVLLQKEFDLNIVVTTHSQEFLEAIELFSKKHGIQGKCNYYLAVQKEGVSEFREVTNDITEIYRQLISPSKYLDRIRFELEEEDE